MTRAAEPCPVCSRCAGHFFVRQRGFDWFSCPGCGSKYLAPRPTASHLRDVYQAYLPTGPREVAAWRRLMEDIFRQALAVLGTPGQEARDLLDVGCAFGFFVEAAAARGWRARGIDVCAGAVAAARERGLPVQQASLEEGEFAPDSFDAITLFYVLEHVRDPRAALRRVFRWLRPGGQLLLRVPHSAPLVRVLDTLGVPNALFDPPHHLQDFAPRALCGLLAETGFERVATYPGAATRPAGVASLLFTKASGALASGLYGVTGGKALLPGVSKTTLARKPAH